MMVVMIWLRCAVTTPEKAIAHVGFWMQSGSKTHCTTRASERASERALPFGVFLSKLQNMFTIFEDAGGGEQLTERAKIICKIKSVSV
jgi:hypothetical protein